MHSHGQDEFLRTAHSDYDVVVCLEGADVVDPEAVRDARSGWSGAAALHEFSAVRRGAAGSGRKVVPDPVSFCGSLSSPPVWAASAGRRA
ncbi:hypothetical protein SUDANB54_06829 [Streptomyces sp. enrichment culture]